MSVKLRQPSERVYLSSTPPPQGKRPIVCAPSCSWLQGSWWVAYSSLPLWKNKQNVTITYTPLEDQNQKDQGPAKDTPSTSFPDLDDLVEYQKLGADPSEKKSSVHGTSRPVSLTSISSGQHDEGEEKKEEMKEESERGLSFHWRGKGWLMIASSDWEILGYGEDGRGNQWVVTFFMKTLFTPAGIDIYQRRPEALTADTFNAIKEQLTALGDQRFNDLVDSLFEIPRVT